MTDAYLRYLKRPGHAPDQSGEKTLIVALQPLPDELRVCLCLHDPTGPAARQSQGPGNLVDRTLRGRLMLSTTAQ